MKNSLKYIIMILLFIILVVSVTITTLYIKYEIKGEFNYSNNYYEIKYSNVMMDDNNIIVKIDENDNSIRIRIPNLKSEANISVDISNIGSKDIIIDNYQILNIDTSLNKDNIIVSTSLTKNEVLKGGSSKKIMIKIKNNNKNSGYYNFSINSILKES